MTNAGCRMETQRSPDVPVGVDHPVYAVPDLEVGISRIQQLLGVRPVLGGHHPDYGTRNAVIALGPKTYLEIIGPDPEQARPERGRLFGLDTLDKPGLVTWALREASIESLAAQAKSSGIPLCIQELARGRTALHYPGS